MKEFSVCNCKFDRNKKWWAINNDLNGVLGISKDFF